MQHFRKYEVAPSTWTTLKKKIQKTDEDGNAYWNPDLVSVLVELGKLCTECGTDSEGETYCIKQNTKLSIDIVWVGEPLADFNEYEVLPTPCGVSSMGYTLDTEYAHHFCEMKPNDPYCLPPTPPELV